VQAYFSGKLGKSIQADSAEQLFASRRSATAMVISAQKIDEPPTFAASRDLASN
jgi:hypothetical protein